MGGGCSSKSFRVNLAVDGQGYKALKTARSLGFTTDEINGLFRHFSKMDIDGSGMISVTPSNIQTTSPLHFKPYVLSTT